MGSRLKSKLYIAISVAWLTIILSLFLSVIVFSVMAVAIYFGFYDNVAVLGLLISLALGITLMSGLVKVS